MVRTCQVCGRLYAGYRCPCRKQPHSRARQSPGSRGGRKWRQAQMEARVLGGWQPEAESGEVVAEEPDAAQGICRRCGTALMEGRCPACCERWSDELRGAAEADDGSGGL